MNGIFTGIGPSFEESSSEADLIDIAPTILHLFNLPIPDHMDGDVLEDAVETGNRIQYVSSDQYQPKFSDEDSEEGDVESRLENLGYL
jgi:arylsulfatase A-like enzyme